MPDLYILYRYRDLLLMWTIREVKVRYKQSLLGAGWAILQPVALTVIFTAVFAYFVRIPTDGTPYPIFAYSALLLWTLLATAISFAVPSVVSNMHLVTKIYFPREILPLACIAAAVLDFAVAALVFVALMVAFGIPITGTWWWAAPLLTVQVALVAGISLLLAGVNVFYRDIRFVVPLGLQLWLYASPIIYPVSAVPEWLQPIYMLNPMAGIINSFRRVMLQGAAPITSEILPATGVSVLLFLVGYWFFKRVEPDFADVM